MPVNENFFPAANLAISGFSILKGAGDTANMAKNEIQMNNLQLGMLGDSLELAEDSYQSQLDLADESFKNTFQDLGVQSGMLWENIGQTMDKTLDVSKFQNYGQFDSNLDIMSRQNRQKFQSEIDNLGIAREKAKGQAEEFIIGARNNIENQKKLLKKKNQQLRKKDSIWENLNQFG